MSIIQKILESIVKAKLGIKLLFISLILIYIVQSLLCNNISGANYGMYAIIILFLLHFIIKFKLLYTDIHNELKQYITLKTSEDSKSSSVKLYVNPFHNKCQAGAIGKSKILISLKWYKHILNNPKHIEYVKCTICHELYHISKNHCWILGIIKSFLFEICPIKRLSHNYFISSWLEEFEADRYGYDICENKDSFIEHMKFMRENGCQHSRTQKNDHPTWNMRIKYITENIEPTLERVKQEYYEYYGIKPNWES